MMGLRAHISVCERLGPLAILAVLAVPAWGLDDKVQYNRDVRPILLETCFACHGADSGSRKADLRLDRRDTAIEMGAIEPGDPENSELYARVVSDDKTLLMPPPSSKKVLTAAQKEVLRRWIAEGAEYEPHWSFVAPKKAEPPAVQGSQWAAGPIDRFVLAKLESLGLKPAPEADRRTLARRLSLDLTGLPPAPALVEAFVADESPNAYEQLVDRLMATPQWGEHRGRYWLDAARYADTHGIHFDNYREMWSYREWVIDAYNKNMPFDQFTIEQLAGDLLPNRTLDQQVASGFNRCNMTTNEGGTIPEEYLVLYDRDRTETVGQVWLGLTAGCAVCHDHKFDPLSQREFYELAAFFNNTTQNAMDGNIRDTPPTIFVPSDGDRDRWNALAELLKGTQKQVEDRKTAARPEFDQWLAGQSPESAAALAPIEKQRVRLALSGRSTAEATPAGLVELADVGDFEQDQPYTAAAWIKPLKNGVTGAIVARMDDRDGKYRGWDLWIEGGRVGAHIIHSWPDNAVKVLGNAALPVNQWSHVAVSYDGSSKAGGVRILVDGVAVPTTVVVDKLQATTRTEVPWKVGQRHAASKVGGLVIGDARVYGRALTADEASNLAGSGRVVDLLANAADKRPPAELDAAFHWWLGALDPTSKEVRARLAALQAEEAAIKTRGTIAHVMQEKPSEAMAYVLFRGDYDKRRDPVKPDTPDALPPMPESLPRNRLGLAQWLLLPDHPLTSRVTVNRAWQELFGQGIVRTSGDFGISGELPTHQELLDWLAVDFRESGWDLKRLYKQLVMSAAYRQSASATPEKIEKDPKNQWLSRGPRFRMDAEMVRDYALAASGLLVEKLGGPSVRPYQPDGVWEAVAMPESNTRNYKADTGEGLYRRSLYTFWKRAAPPASMDIFNAPNRETCTVRRERTNTPMQALVTLNDPQFVEAARRLAERALKEGGESPESRLDFIARLLLARPFRSEEAPIVQKSLDGLLAYYNDHADDAAKLIAVGESKADPSLSPQALAAWTMLANELLNLDEVVNK